MFLDDTMRKKPRTQKKCRGLMPAMSWPFVIFFVLHTACMIGFGVLIGYVSFRPSSNIIVTNPMTTTNVTSAPTTTPLETLTDRTTVFTASNVPITVTTSVVPPPTTTTTSLILPDPCPPILSQSTTSKILLSLDQTISLTTFTKYSFEYISPATVTTGMLMFEFKTVWGSWYVDDISVKERTTTNQELIENGGFETGQLGSKWKSCDPRYPWVTGGTIVSHTAHSGLYSYESQDPGVGSEEYLTQILNIKSDTNYMIEFYVFYSGEPSSAIVTIIS